jgi:hypothetical protein
MCLALYSFSAFSAESTQTEDKSYTAQIADYFGSMFGWGQDDKVKKVTREAKIDFIPIFEKQLDKKANIHSQKGDNSKQYGNFLKKLVPLFTVAGEDFGYPFNSMKIAGDSVYLGGKKIDSQNISDTVKSIKEFLHKYKTSEQE